MPKTMEADTNSVMEKSITIHVNLIYHIILYLTVIWKFLLFQGAVTLAKLMTIYILSLGKYVYCD